MTRARTTQAERNDRARADQARERSADLIVRKLAHPPMPDHWVVVYTMDFRHRMIMLGSNLESARWNVEHFGTDRYKAVNHDVDQMIRNMGYLVSEKVTLNVKREYEAHVRRS